MTIINKGKAIVQGRVSELLSNEEMIISIEPSELQLAVEVVGASEWRTAYQGEADGILTFHISKASIPDLASFFAQKGVSLYSLQYRRSLEDYFLKLTQQI